MRNLRLVLWLLAGAIVAACQPLPFAAPTAVSATSSPTTIPTAEASPQECPSPSGDTLLLRNEDDGYCLLYPEGYSVVIPFVGEICLVPGEPGDMMCHNMRAMIEVTAADGRSAGQAADEALVQLADFPIERSTLSVAGEEATVLDNYPGVDILRLVFFIHGDRLYRMTFMRGSEAGSEERLQADLLFSTLVDSFTFIPGAPPPASTGRSPGSGGSGVVVFVEGGDVLVWEETTGDRRTLVDSGDAIRVELSDDAQLVAFVRRSFFAAGGFDNNEQSALWVVGLDGANPRELLSAAELRQQVGAAEGDSTNFPRLGWIPNTHRLLYSGNAYDAHGYGEGAHTALKGVYSIDADTRSTSELAPPETSFHFVASPDGQHVALVDTTGLVLVEVENGRRLREFPAQPVVGDKGWFAGAGVWTQDSSSFVVNAVVEPTNIVSDYELWRVPVDGSPAARLLSFSSGGGSVVYAPDGSSAAMLISASGIGPSAWAITPLPEDLGALAVPSDVNDYSQFNWSPAGAAYVIEPLVFDSQGGMHGRENLFPLCPNAVQATEVCGPAIPFGEQIEWMEWVDRNRFLYVTYEPRRLYLGSVEGPATLIAEDSPSFAAATATCRNDSEFVADVTISDGTHFGPGAVFQKTWRLRNSGTCTWDDSYRLGYLAGDRMSGPRTSPLGDSNISREGTGLFPTVQPGQEIDVSILLVAPDSAGTYLGQWRMIAPDGRPFGTTPYVTIQVP
jgi:hypothetical protein